MKKLCVVAFAAASFFNSYGQTLYVPSGTSGIGSSSNGNVGIGNSNPGAKLEVTGPASGAGPTIFVGGGGDLMLSLAGTLFFDANYSYSTGNYIRPMLTNTQAYFTSGQERMRITSSGNIGIGTTSPSAKLEINQAGGATGQNVGTKIWAGNTSNYFGNTQIQFSYGGGGAAYAHAIKSRHNAGALSGNAIDFFLYQPGDNVNGEGSLSVMSLNGGNVGIGTTSPSDKLSVSGGAITLDADQPLRGGGRWLISGNSSQVTVGTTNPGINLRFDAGAAARMFVDGASGFVGIGTSSPDYPLTIKGSVHAKEIRVDLTGALSVPDYVFEKDYKLASLEDIKTYIDQNKHLPEVPSAKEIEKNGVQLGEMNLILLKKIEELTLYILKQEERAAHQEERIKTLEKLTLQK